MREEMNAPERVTDAAERPGEVKKKAPPLKTLYRLLQVTILVGAFFDAIEFVKPGISTASLTVPDLLLSVVYLVWLFQTVSGRIRLPRFSRNKALYLFICILLVPIPIGLMHGHLLQTVLRDARAPYYFVLSLVVISFTEDEKAFKKLLKTCLVIGVVALVVGYIVYIFKIPITTGLQDTLLSSGVQSRRFGYHSSHVLLLVCMLLLANYLLIMPDGKKGRTKALTGLLLFAGGVCLTLIRSLFMGMVSGFIVSVLIQKGKAKGFVILGMVLLAGFAAFLFQFASPEMIGTAMKVPMVERYASMVDPSLTTAASRNNAEGRLDAPGMIMKYGLTEDPFLGIGYGEFRKPRDAADVVDPLFVLVGHSTVSWMLLRTGYFGTFVLSACLLAFFVRGMRSFRLSAKKSWYRLGYGTTSAFLVGILVTGTGGNMMYGSERFSPLIAMMIGLLLSKQREQRHVEPTVEALGGPKAT
jgi:hypothetical protein